MGHAGTIIEPAAMLRFYALTIPALVLSPLCIFAAIGIFMRRKFGWYLSITVWMFSIAYLVYATLYLFPTAASLEHLFIAVIALVNIVFIGYFQSERVRDYFMID